MAWYVCIYSTCHYTHAHTRFLFNQPIFSELVQDLFLEGESAHRWSQKGRNCERDQSSHPMPPCLIGIEACSHWMSDRAEFVMQQTADLRRSSKIWSEELLTDIEQMNFWELLWQNCQMPFLLPNQRCEGTEWWQCYLLLVAWAALTVSVPDLETTCCHHAVMVSQEHGCGYTFYGDTSLVRRVTVPKGHRSELMVRVRVRVSTDWGSYFYIPNTHKVYFAMAKM